MLAKMGRTSTPVIAYRRTSTISDREGSQTRSISPAAGFGSTQLPAHGDVIGSEIGVAAMPFRSYGAFFRPDELDVLNDAYDAAWQRVSFENGEMTPTKVADLKNRLAKMILASACTGERYRERLVEIAAGVLGGIAEPQNGTN
jgi:hypothetical protein